MADRPPPYVTNERYESVSRTLFQLGAALFAAGAVRIYAVGHATFETSAWLFAGLALYTRYQAHRGDD